MKCASWIVLLLALAVGILKSTHIVADPPRHGLSRPAKLDPSKKSIIFVHGLGSTCQATFADFSKWAQAASFQVLEFDYPNHGPIAKSGRMLADELRRLEAEFPTARFVIVSHSMGGLVSRHALEVVRPAPRCVADLVTIATPHEGTLLADGGHGLRFLEAVVRGPSKGFINIFANGRSEACRDLVPGSEFLTELKAAKRDSSVRYHVLLGRKAFLTGDEWAKQQKEILRIGEHRLDWSADQLSSTAKRLASLDEVVHGNGDGVVAVRRGKLEGVPAASGSIDAVYGEFHCRRCAAWPERWATTWVPLGGGFRFWDEAWVCDEVAVQLPKEGRKEVVDKIEELRAAPRPGRPAPSSRLAAAASYGLASRHGDILVRAVVNPTQEADLHPAWIRDAALGLAAITLTLFALSFVVLKVQLAGCHARHFRARVARLLRFRK